VERRLKREDTVKEKIKGRRIKKGRRVSNSQRLSGNFSVSPVKYGMDAEHQKLVFISSFISLLLSPPFLLPFPS
jgi:hypothetical protein